jgi:DNA repair protein RecO (recombination protein O)
MDNVKVNGMIIREIDLGDTDKLITVLTDTMGKITVSCKGVRSIKSKRLASSQLFCYGELLLSVRAGKYYLADATVENSFFELNSSLEKLSLAQYFCQVANAVTVENEDQSEILSLLLNCVYVLCNNKRPHELVKAVFEMRLCALLGFCPDLSACAGCSCEPKDGQGVFYLHVSEGCMFCADCILDENGKLPKELSSTKTPVFPLTYSMLNTLRYITGAPAKKIFSFTLTNSDNNSNDPTRTLGEITEGFLLYYLDRSFETLDFYHSIQGL